MMIGSVHDYTNTNNFHPWASVSLGVANLEFFFLESFRERSRSLDLVHFQLF